MTSASDTVAEWRMEVHSFQTCNHCGVGYKCGSGHDCAVTPRGNVLAEPWATEMRQMKARIAELEGAAGDYYPSEEAIARYEAEQTGA